MVVQNLGSKSGDCGFKFLLQSLGTFTHTVTCRKKKIWKDHNFYYFTFFYILLFYNFLYFIILLILLYSCSLTSCSHNLGLWLISADKEPQQRMWRIRCGVYGPPLFAKISFRQAASFCKGIFWKTVFLYSTLFLDFRDPSHLSNRFRDGSGPSAPSSKVLC